MEINGVKWVSFSIVLLGSAVNSLGEYDSSKKRVGVISHFFHVYAKATKFKNIGSVCSLRYQGVYVNSLFINEESEGLY